MSETSSTLHWTCVHARFLFTKQELLFLSKHGATLEALATQKQLPINPSQERFVTAIVERKKPETTLEILWLRYAEAGRVDKALRTLMQEVSNLQEKLDSERVLRAEENRMFKQAIANQYALIKNLHEQYRYQQNENIDALLYATDYDNWRGPE